MRLAEPEQLRRDRQSDQPARIGHRRVLDLFLMQKFKLGVPWIIGISAALGLLFFGVLGL